MQQLTRLAMAGIAVLAVGLGALAGCESVANLDVRYDSTLVLADGGEAGAEGGPTRQEVEGCPCDETQGLGCCIPKDGLPFCTTNDSLCTIESKGVFARCLFPDGLSESKCCWHGPNGIGALAALAVSCDAGPSACTRNSDCPNGVTCSVSECSGVKIGRCENTAPVCPK